MVRRSETVNNVALNVSWINHKKVRYNAGKQEKALSSKCGGVALQRVA